MVSPDETGWKVAGSPASQGHSRRPTPRLCDSLARVGAPADDQDRAIRQKCGVCPLRATASPAGRLTTRKMRTRGPLTTRAFRVLAVPRN